MEVVVGEKEVVALALSSRKAPTCVPEYGVRQLPSKFSTPVVSTSSKKLLCSLPKIFKGQCLVVMDLQLFCWNLLISTHCPLSSERICLGFKVHVQLANQIFDQPSYIRQPYYPSLNKLYLSLFFTSLCILRHPSG